MTAVETVQAIEKRLGPLAALQDLSRRTDERLEALNALAEEVTGKEASAQRPEGGDRACHGRSRSRRRPDGRHGHANCEVEGRGHLLEQTEARLGRLEEVVLKRLRNSNEESN